MFCELWLTHRWLRNDIHYRGSAFFISVLLSFLLSSFILSSSESPQWKMEWGHKADVLHSIDPFEYTCEYNRRKWWMKIVSAISCNCWCDVCVMFFFFIDKKNLIPDEITIFKIAPSPKSSGFNCTNQQEIAYRLLSFNIHSANFGVCYARMKKTLEI